MTAVETTPGSVTENRKLLDLIDQHETNTGKKVEKVVGDHKYGTQDNFVACQQRGISTHLGDLQVRIIITHEGSFPKAPLFRSSERHFSLSGGRDFNAAAADRVRHTMEYKARSGACAACVLRPQCTRAKFGRTLKRHEHQAALDLARKQAHSRAARRDRRRRQQLMEQSFADATNNHHFKRARWRRLWRQQIQDYLIAAIQNVRILLAHRKPKHSAPDTLTLSADVTRWQPCLVY